MHGGAVRRIAGDKGAKVGNYVRADFLFIQKNIVQMARPMRPSRRAAIRIKRGAFGLKMKCSEIRNATAATLERMINQISGLCQRAVR